MHSINYSSRSKPDPLIGFIPEDNSGHTLDGGSVPDFKFLILYSFLSFSANLFPIMNPVA